MRFTRKPVRHSGLRRALAMSASVGIVALCGPAIPAAAQSPTPEGPNPDLDIRPAPLNPSLSAGSGSLTPAPDVEKQHACMQASNGGPPIEEEPWSQQVLNFERAHAQGQTGEGQTVAVIDTGVNDHPWLPGLQGGGSAVPQGGALTDCDGHGTIVAGIIAADTPDGIGFTGIAPDATILSIRQSSAVWQNTATGATIGNTLTMARAINNAVDQGASVINISQSSCQPMSSVIGKTGNAQLHTAVYEAYRAGVVVVAAAGNEGGKCQANPPKNPTTAVLPAWFDKYVLTVASVNQQGAPSTFTVAGPWVDVAAPGEDLTALDPGVGATGLATQVSHGESKQPQPIQGTSFAAPYVSGLAALIQEKYPELGPGEIMRRITVTAQHPGGTDGRNDIIGYGMINPMAALNDVIPAEHGAAAAPVGPRRLEADVFPRENWAGVAVATGGAAGGLATVLFTAFLMNAVRKVRRRQADNSA